ncbi:MAG: hypothetical protein AB7U73_00200 [Pirellulales bacterium]
MADSRHSPAAAGPTTRISPPLKIVLSVLLALHVTALVVCPWSIEGSPLAQGMWRVFRPYVEATFLNHGYHFFAPEPGPSHLVRYEVELPNGDTFAGEIPNLKEEQPRLLYHRHFMLTEFLNMLYGNVNGDAPMASPPAGGDTATTAAAQRRDALAGIEAVPGREALPPSESAQQFLAAQQALFDAYCRSYATHLLRKHNAQRVTLRLVRHNLPFPQEIAQQRVKTLSDASLYVELFSKSYTAEDL